MGLGSSTLFRLAIVGAAAFAVGAIVPSSAQARTRKATTATNFVQRLDRLVLGRQAHRHVRLSPADRRKLRGLNKRFASKKGRAGARREFARLAKGRAGGGRPHQLDAMVGSVAYGAQSEQIPNLGKLVGGLEAKSAQAVLVRNKLKCKGDDLKTTTGGLARSRIWCTPAVPTSSSVEFRDWLRIAKAITIQVKAVESAVGGPRVAQRRALAALATPIGAPQSKELGDAEDLLAEFMKLNAQDPDGSLDDHKNAHLLVKLAKLQSEYEDASAKCAQGNNAECAKAEALAAQIAELEVQLASL
jgi:hypothetical protein